MFYQVVTFIVGIFGSIITWLLAIQLAPNLTLGGIFAGTLLIGMLMAFIKSYSGLSEIVMPKVDASGVRKAHQRNQRQKQSSNKKVQKVKKGK